MTCPLTQRRLATLLFFLTAAACGSGPQVRANQVSTPELEVRFGSLPADWHRVEAEGALVAFREPKSRATLALNGRCGRDGDDVPLEVLTDHLFLQFEERTILRQERRRLDGRAALRTQLRAELDGVAQSFDVVVMKKNGCVFDFLLIGPLPTAPAVTAQFETFVDGFRTLRP